MYMDSAGRATLWTPTADGVRDANLTRFMDWLRRERALGFADYESLRRWSVADLPAFWRSIWDHYEVRASAPFTRVLGDARMPGARWFKGARLNYAEHLLGRASRQGPILIAVGEDHQPVEITRAELRGRVGALGAALRSLGVRRGDRVAAYVGNIPEAVVAMLAVTSVGAVWTACAPDFGVHSVLDRFVQVEPSLLIAVDGYRFGGRDRDRLETVRELQAGLPTVRTTIVVRSLRGDSAGRLNALAFDELAAPSRDPEFEQVPFDHPLWVLYSSGSTGVPKGIVHGHSGILLEHLKSLGLGMDLRPGDRHFFYSSTSWMAWNYLVAGLLHGASIVVYDGSPSYPDQGGSWAVASLTHATTFGMGAAYVSACEKAGVRPARGRELSSLRSVIPTGSPLPPSGWHWIHDQLGSQVRIDPIAGGTDVCTAFVGGNPLLPVRVGEIPCRWLGNDIEVLDAGGQTVRDTVGEFTVLQPMPSMPLRLWNDDDDGSRYAETYFSVYPGVWRQGDWATISSSGSLTLLGRSDATLNRGGVRIGSAEIYAVVEQRDDIVDSLVVGVETTEGGYYMPLFVVLADGVELDDGLRHALARQICAELSPRHIPDEIVAAPGIPRTLTGKKLEVPVKRIIQGWSIDQAVSLGAIDRPELLDWYSGLVARRTPVSPVH
jgi:acetoacetyl-CoA synthetase